MEQKYTYSIANDCPGSPNGKVHSENLKKKIQDTAAITISINRINTNNDDLDLWFNGTVPAEQLPLITNAVATHSLTPPTTVLKTTPVDQIGGPETLIGSVTVSCDESTNKTSDFVITENAHLWGLQAQWKGVKLGDYAEMGVAVMSSKTSPQVQSNLGTNTITLTSDNLAALYNPAGPAGPSVCVDILDENGVWKETKKITSVSGSIITLDSNLSQDVLTTYTLYSIPRKNVFSGSGFSLLKDPGDWVHAPQKALTQVLPAGTIFYVRLFTSVLIGTRELVINFICRRPEA